MSGFGRRFSPDELDDTIGEADVVAVMAVARALEAIADTSAGEPTSDFADRVMAAIAVEPAPAPTRALGAALGGGRPLAVMAAVRDGWRVAFGARRPIAMRAQGLGFVLVSAIALATLGGVAAGALGLIGPDRGPSPSVAAPSPSVSPSSSPSPSPSPAPSVSPSPSTSPAAPSASPSVEPTGTAEPGETETAEPDETETAEPTDDDNSGPGGGDDGGSSGRGSGSGSGSGDDG